VKSGKPITVTDGNLPTGGRFDLNLDWRPLHQQHMNGRNADVRSRDMSAGEREIFRSEAQRLGFVVRFEGDPQHWHLRLPE
jgi:hypothetical protein